MTVGSTWEHSTFRARRLELVVKFVDGANRLALKMTGDEYKVRNGIVSPTIITTYLVAPTV